MRFILVISVLAIVACGGGSGGNPDAGQIASCDLRTTLMYCQEYTVPSETLGPYEMACTNAAGTWSSTTPCPRTNAVGGCRTNSGYITNWFYEGGPYPDETMVRMVCAAGAEPATFVAP